MFFFLRLCTFLMILSSCFSLVLGQGQANHDFPFSSIVDKPFEVQKEIDDFAKAGIEEGFKVQINKAQLLVGQAEAVNNDFHLITTYLLLGKIYNYSGEYAYAMKYLEMALVITRKYPYQIINYLVLLEEGLLYLKIGKIEEGITHLSGAYEIIKTRKKDIAGFLQYLIANEQYHQKNYGQAVKYGKNAVLHFGSVPSDSLIHYQKEFISAWNTVGLAYEKLGSFEKSLDGFKYAYQLADQWNNYFWKSLIIGNIGSVYAKQGRVQEALPMLSKDLENNINEGEWRCAIGSALSLVDVYSQLGNFKKAMVFHDSASNMIANRDDYYLDQYYAVGALLYAREKDYEKAYDFQERLMKIRDSTANNSFKTRLEKAKTLYDFDKQQSEISLLAKNNALQKSNIRKKNMTVVVAVFGFLLVLILSIILFRNLQQKKKDNIKLFEQQEEIKSQNESLKQQRQQLEEKSEIIAGINDNLEEVLIQRGDELNEINRELDNFIYRASHDIRAPLRTIIGLEGVAQTKKPSAELLEVLSKIKDTALGMDGMLLKLQKAHSLNLHRSQIKISDIDMPLLVQEVVQGFANLYVFEKANIIQDIEQVKMTSSPELLSLVMTNLIENGLKFGDPKAPTLHITGTSHYGIYKVTVSDNGISIEPKFKEKIFDAFFKASDKSNGAGLGLYLVKKAVDILGGGISVDSNEENGTTFTVYLPIQN